MAAEANNVTKPTTTFTSHVLKIGIVGFGKFGQFLAKTMNKQGHSLIATSRSDYSDVCQALGVTFFRDPREFCKERPDVILVCTTILAMESTLRSFPLEELNIINTLFVDVLSVKEFPRNLFLEVLPEECEILCTHPMFGPESGKTSWAGLPLVYDKVRISEVGSRAQKCNDFLSIFESEGCKMVEMSCTEHDRYAAETQFLTHTVGRILSLMNLEPTPIDTKSYETLRHLTETMSGHSMDLYNGLFLCNANSMEQMEKLERAFDTVKNDLLGRLHGMISKQLVHRVPGSAPSPPASSTMDANSLKGAEKSKIQT
ncbi:hypothetical protein SUGI_0971940 [Cryptomeria japonica]|nr:hypothetical protein SUGI_0971940 [Cryptomeria japonica]